MLIDSCIIAEKHPFILGSIDEDPFLVVHNNCFFFFPLPSPLCFPPQLCILSFHVVTALLPCPSCCQPFTTLSFMLTHYPVLHLVNPTLPCSSCCHPITTLFFHVVTAPLPFSFMLSTLHHPVLSCCHPSTILSFMLSPLHNPVLQQCFLSRFIQSNRGIIAVQINNLSFKDDHTGSQKQELRGAIGWLL